MGNNGGGGNDGSCGSREIVLEMDGDSVAVEWWRWQRVAMVIVVLVGRGMVVAEAKGAVTTSVVVVVFEWRQRLWY